MDTKPDGYVVVDIDGQLFKYNRRFVWMSSGAAKNAWNAAQQWDAQCFNDQTRYRVRPVRMFDAETGDYFT